MLIASGVIDLTIWPCMYLDGMRVRASHPQGLVCGKRPLHPGHRPQAIVVMCCLPAERSARCSAGPAGDSVRVRDTVCRAYRCASVRAALRSRAVVPAGVARLAATEDDRAGAAASADRLLAAGMAADAGAPDRVGRRRRASGLRSGLGGLVVADEGIGEGAVALPARLVLAVGARAVARAAGPRVVAVVVDTQRTAGDGPLVPDHRVVDDECEGLRVRDRDGGQPKLPASRAHLCVPMGGLGPAEEG